MQTQTILIDGQKTFDGKDFPLCISPSVQNLTLDEFVAQIEQNRAQLDGMLREHKAIFFRDFPVANVEAFDRVVQATGLNDMPYLGGAAVRTQITPRVFTANESPSSEKIPFHHEMAQVPHPPTHLFFYCEVPCDTGGETPLLPSAEICNRMKIRFPEFMERLQRFGVQYVRVMPREDDPTSAIGRGWQSTFLTQSKEEVEARLTELGSTWEWLGDDLKTVTAVLPALRVDEGPHRSNELTFFNSMVAAYMGWNDSRNTGKDAVRLGDGSPCDEDAILAAVEIMDQVSCPLRWQSNDFVLIDNRTVMHSRRPFEGKRRVLASLIRDHER